MTEAANSVCLQYMILNFYYSVSLKVATRQHMHMFHEIFVLFTCRRQKTLIIFIYFFVPDYEQVMFCSLLVPDGGTLMKKTSTIFSHWKGYFKSAVMQRFRTKKGQLDNRHYVTHY